MSKIYFYKTSADKVRAIIIVPIPGQEKPAAKKYEYVYNSPKGINTFLAFAKRTFRDATHINFYCRKTNQFLERIYLE